MSGLVITLAIVGVLALCVQVLDGNGKVLVETDSKGQWKRVG